MALKPFVYLKLPYPVEIISKRKSCFFRSSSSL